MSLFFPFSEEHSAVAPRAALAYSSEAMKSAPFLAGFCAVLGAAGWLARADDSAPVDLKSTVPLQAPAPGIAPAAPVDDTDFSTSDPEQIAEQTLAFRQQQKDTPDFDAYDRQQRQQAYDHDWMLRDYTAQLKKQGMANTPETDPSMVPQPADPNASSVYKDPLLPENQPKSEKSNDSRTDANSNPSSQLTPSSSLSPLALQPMLAPLNPGPKRTAPRDAWGGTDSSADDTLGTDTSDTLPGASAPDFGNSDSSGSLLDSPGMTAQQEGLTKFNDLSLQDEDPMPDVVNTDRGTPHVNRNNNFLVPTAPASDVADFFKKQAEALAPPTAPTAAQPPGAATAALKPLPPVDAPEPLARPPTNNMRTHVADPFDILNR
jgi:hypothetical protein